jgi:deoxyribodipyrimidine photo-lyase
VKVLYGLPEEVFPELMSTYKVKAVYTNHDYEPYAQQRDAQINALLAEKGVNFHTFKDQVIFERNEVMKDDGGPYTVFTPYSRKWKIKLQPEHYRPFASAALIGQLLDISPQPLPTLKVMNFEDMTLDFPIRILNMDVVRHYKERRDFPSINGTTRLSVHLRFGTISIRELVRAVRDISESFLNELIWREFYQMILWNFPSVGEGKAFKPAYDRIDWRQNEEDFQRWCNGQTGYPIVDAGMRELNQTGFMHNRVRMIVASFLCKHLLIDWRKGEAYFAEKLLDFDLSANNGGWQWAAGSGCDAAPYFRVFNPRLQTEKFDRELTYIRKWVPEFQEFHYPKPMVDHDFARKRCLEVYAKALKS